MVLNDALRLELDVAESNLVNFCRLTSLDSERRGHMAKLERNDKDAEGQKVF